MFHALHCLNRLRKSFWPEYYPEPPHRNHFIHRGGLNLVPFHDFCLWWNEIIVLFY